MMEKVGWLALAVIVSGGGVLAVQQMRSAPQPSGHSSQTPDLSETAEGAPIVEVALPATLSGNAKIGKRVFEAKCATCHGTNAVGQNGVAPPVVHKIYEPGHHSDMAFVMAAKNGVRSHHWSFGNMPPVEGVTDGDVKMVSSYIRELQRANSID